MNGFGSGSAFGQQTNPQQGANNSFGSQAQTPPANGLGFGAKRTQSFAGPSSTSTGGGGLFGSTGGSSLFGQNNNNQPSTGTGSGLFGGSAPTSSTGGTGLFGNTGSNSNTSNTSGGLFGNTNNQNTSTGGGGGLFGNQSKPLFGAGAGAGSGSASGPSGNTGGGLFGQSNTSAPQPPAGGGLFGNSGANNTQSGGLGGGLFGNSTSNNTSGGGLFGNKPATGTNPSTNTGGGLFGNSGSSTGGGLFGSSNNTNAPPSTSLFNQSQQPAQQQQPQQPLIASIDQASYTLPGVAPAQKLYTSLSVQGTKRGLENSETYDYEPKSSGIQTRTSFAKPRRTSLARSHLHPGTPKDGTASVSGSLASSTGLISSKQTMSSTTAQGEPRKWINSYEKFVRERPTTLMIRNEGRKPVTALLPAPETAPVSTEPPAIASISDGNASVVANPVAESSMRSELPAIIDNEPDVSLFHRQANNMTLVRVNKRAVDEGYYIYPRLEDLAAMSKPQLSAVKHLVVGRENYGQIEYPGAVDLSQIGNLGDIIGTLVIFGPGTVCVYPDEATKALPGRELNMPCTVTIENAWPKDASTHNIVRDMEDPRMIKHVQRLRKACEGRGGEFVTFAQGIWVFKVPHFSTWGLPAEEMIIDDDMDDAEAELGADIVDDMDDADDKIAGQAAAATPFIAAPQLTSSPVLSAAEDGAPVNADGRFGFGEGEIDGTHIEVDGFDGEEYPLDANAAEAEKPETWLEQLVHASNGVLLAASGSLAAASAPTSKLDLESILDPSWKSMGNISRSKGTDGNQDSDDLISTPEPSSFNAKASSLRLNTLRQRIQKHPRADSNLPRLSTNINFADILNFSDQHKDLWELLSIMFDGPEEDGNVDKTKLCSWFDKKVKSTETNYQGDALDTIWQLVSRHQIKEAYEHSISSNNLHLGLLISMLGSSSNLKTLKEDADRQLNDWKASRSLPSIPINVRRIWELAAGNIPHGAGFTWTQWLGIHFWYFSNSSIKSAVGALPSTYAGSKDPELTFLEFYAGSKQLRTALNELDLMNSFLCLQAMFKNRPSAVKADLKCHDNVCVKLAESFDREGDPTSAVFVALHVTDSKVATKTMRSILQRTPVTVSLPLDFGVPEQFLDESRAFQVAREGEYEAQAEYLVRAGLYNEAHKVILATVGPNAVLSGNTSQLMETLVSLEKVKNQIKRWEIGGNVYLMYARALTETPDQYTVVALCNALRYVETPTLRSKEAISRIAEWVAATPFAKSTITSQMILRMKFDPSQARVQTLQEASRLLG